jgi:Tol biopolymer transport system component
MLTGRQTFGGETVSHVLAAVLKDAPDWTTLPANTPSTIRRLLRRCLEKDRTRRLESAADARLEIDDALTTPVEEAPRPTSPRRVGGLRFALALVGGVLATLGAVAGWAARAPAAAEGVAFKVDTPASRRLDAFAISPDGRQLAFVAIDKDGQERLWLRPLASADARVLAGTESAVSPFWSPDSRTVAFFTVSELKRIDIAGGAAQTICRTSGGPGGGAWSEQQVILFSVTSARGVFRVPATGGEPQAVTTLRGDAIAHLWPTFMPDGRHFIYLSSTGRSDDSQLIWRALDSSEEHVVRPMFSKAFYSHTGHLLFRLGGPIVAQPFDPIGGTVSGTPVQVTPETMQPGTQTALAVSSSGGVLAHRAGQPTRAQLSWMDRDGKALNTVGAAANYWNPYIDLAGERIVANTTDGPDVWLLDGARGTASRLTFDPAPDSDPIFSPDGRWVAFYSGRQPPGIYRKASSGAGADELVAATGPATYPRDWSLDGQFLLYDSGPGGTMWGLPTDGDRKPFPYPPGVPKGAKLTSGHFSGNAKWVAYVSDETGQPEIFVQDFPSGAAKFQVSIAGGTEPRWRRDGRELYFLAADGRIMALDVEITPTFRLGVPKPLFQTRLNMLAPPARRYGVSADGKRFMMNVPVGTDAVPPITVVMNWAAGLKN